MSSSEKKFYIAFTQQVKSYPIPENDNTPLWDLSSLAQQALESEGIDIDLESPADQMDTIVQDVADPLCLIESDFEEVEILQQRHDWEVACLMSQVALLQATERESKQEREKSSETKKQPTKKPAKKSEAKMRAEFEAQFKAQVELQVEEQIDAKLEAKMNAKIEAEMNAKMNAQIEAQMNAKLEAIVTQKLHTIQKQHESVEQSQHDEIAGLRRTVDAQQVEIASLKGTVCTQQVEIASLRRAAHREMDRVDSLESALSLLDSRQIVQDFRLAVSLSFSLPLDTRLEQSRNDFDELINSQTAKIAEHFCLSEDEVRLCTFASFSSTQQAANTVAHPKAPQFSARLDPALYHIFWAEKQWFKAGRPHWSPSAEQ